MCNFKSALLIPRFPSSDGFDIFHSEGVDSHTKLMELSSINPNDKSVKVAKLELIPNDDDPANINKWEFVLDEKRKPDWLDDAMLSDAEYELRQICLKYLTKDGEYTILDINKEKCWYLNGKLHREDGPAIERANGDKEWYINGRRHREDGPACERANGDKYWWINDKIHREDGPAVEYENIAARHWYIHGKRHREDGPAVEWLRSDGFGGRKWFINGELHREDGPACEHDCGERRWYIRGVRFTEEEFNQR